MMIWVWVALLVAFVIIEVSTTQLVTIWFAIGSLAAAVTSFFTESILLQVVVFALVSVISLIATRPFVKKITKTQKHPTNADAYIGKEGIVTERIDNLNSTGAVKVQGSVWTARCTDEKTIIPIGSTVKVQKIEGVKFIVEPITVKEESQCHSSH